MSTSATNTFGFIADPAPSPLRIPRLRLVSGGTVGIVEPPAGAADASSTSVEGQLQPSSEHDLWAGLARIALKFLIEAAPSTSATEAPVPDQADALVARLTEALRAIGDGVFLARNEEENLWEAFVVASDHTDALYEAVVAAEEKLLASVTGINLEVRVRAHQGEPMESVVPWNARRILPS